MKSRYDYMTASKVLDEDGEEYPDCLTADYTNTKITEIPLPNIIAQGDLEKFWLYMYRLYGVPYYDDLLLNINQIPYIGFLQPGSTLMNLKYSDLIQFNTNKVPEES